MFNKRQSTSATADAKAQRIKSRSESKEEAKLIDRESDIEEKVATIETAFNTVGNRKGTEIRQLTSSDVRALAGTLITADEYPPELKTTADIVRAVKVLLRLNHELVEQRGRVLSDLQDTEKAKLAPLRADLEKVKAELTKVQSQLQNA